MKWTAEFTVEFTPVPPEMEEARHLHADHFKHIRKIDQAETGNAGSTPALGSQGWLP